MSANLAGRRDKKHCMRVYPLLCTFENYRGTPSVAGVNFRLFSTKSLLIYYNADTQKLKILKDNKGKSGIYRFINKNSGKSYVGSALDLSKRFRVYYSLLSLEKYGKKSKIYSALLKYGYSQFSLEILEYCTPEKCIEREQYYLDLLRPEYNILLKAGSSLGFTHSEEALIKMSAVHKGKRVLAETRVKISTAMKGRKRPEGSGTPAQKISVMDLETKLTTEYASMSDAAKALGIRISSISTYFLENRLTAFKGRYIFKKI